MMESLDGDSFFPCFFYPYIYYLYQHFVMEKVMVLDYPGAHIAYTIKTLALVKIFRFHVI